MTMVDQLVAAVEASSADAGKKAVAKAFLTAAGPAIEMLGTDLFSQVLQSAAAGAGVEAIVQGLDEKQVVGMLAGVEGEMGVLAQSHQSGPGQPAGGGGIPSGGGLYGIGPGSHRGLIEDFLEWGLQLG